MGSAHTGGRGGKSQCELFQAPVVVELNTAARLRRPTFQLLWHKPFPSAPQLFDICATERLFVSQHADFQASSQAEGWTRPVISWMFSDATFGE